MSPEKHRFTMNRNDFLRCAAIFALAAAPHLAVHAEREADDGSEDARSIKPTFGVEARPAQSISLSIPLTGMGVQAAVTFSAPSPALTSTPASTTEKKGTIAVTNTGTGPLTLSAAPTITKTTGAPGSAFSITGGTCKAGVVVAAGGGTCTIVVRYSPERIVTPQGRRSTAANATMSTAHVTLTGTGAATAAQKSPSFRGN